MSTDVCHVNAQALALPFKVQRQLSANLSAVDVAENAAHWLERFQPIEHFDWAEVTGVPHFVAFLEVGKDRLVKKSMGIREQANLHDYIVGDQLTKRAFAQATRAT